MEVLSGCDKNGWKVTRAAMQRPGQQLCPPKRELVVMGQGQCGKRERNGAIRIVQKEESGEQSIGGAVGCVGWPLVSGLWPWVVRMCDGHSDRVIEHQQHSLRHMQPDPIRWKDAFLVL